MAKLHATLSASPTAKMVSKSSNEVLTMQAFVGNKLIALVTMNVYTNTLTVSERNGNNFSPVFHLSLSK